jgi:hypothetical protein
VLLCFADGRHIFDDSFKRRTGTRYDKGRSDPGIDFGSGGDVFLRFSYANTLENIK